MRKFLTTLGVGLTALALLLGAAPARAGEASWKDPEGDAVGYLGATPPRPSEAAYDVLGVNLTSDGTLIKVNAQFKKLGAIPPQATGNTYRFIFKIGDGTYTLSVIQDRVAGNFSTFAVRDAVTGVNTATECIKCTGKLNMQANRVELQIPVSALESARKAAKVAPPKIGPGTKMEGVKMEGGEYYNLGYSIPGSPVGLFSLSNTADTAALPAPGTFSI
jgi:hypothetical protein